MVILLTYLTAVHRANCQGQLETWPQNLLHPEIRQQMKQDSTSVTDLWHLELPAHASSVTDPWHLELPAHWGLNSSSV